VRMLQLLKGFPRFSRIFTSFGVEFMQLEATPIPLFSVTYTQQYQYGGRKNVRSRSHRIFRYWFLIQTTRH